MKEKKRISILATILLLTIFAAMLIMSMNIIEQNDEITSLIRRVQNLEVVVNEDYEFRIEKKELKQTLDNSLLAAQKDVPLL
jgi:regulator of replication initiation timing